MTYPRGRYRFDAGAGLWRSGRTLGPPSGVAHTYAEMLGSGLSGTVAPPDTFVLGTTKPDATNTGIPAGTTLTNYTGPSTINSPVNLSNMRFNSFIQIASGGSGSTFTNCLFRGPSTAPTSPAGLLTGTTGVSGVNVNFCTFKPQAPSQYNNGIYGYGGFTISRCDMSNVVDGIDPFGGVWTVTGTYIHDFAYYSPSPTHSDNQTHNDAMQIEGATGVTVVGCNFQAFADLSISINSTGLLGPQGQVNSCFQITPDVDYITGLNINDNWMDGGGYSVNIASRTSAPARAIGTLGTMQRNKFGRLQRITSGGGPDTGYTIVMTKTGSLDTGDGTANQNIYEDNGHAILVRRTNT
jgi:hypothetical protein